MAETYRGRVGAFVLESSGLSDIGRTRESNQDAIYMDNGEGVFVLADGMGGHRGGERASRLAVEVAGRLLSRRRTRVPLSPNSKESLKDSAGAALLTRTAILKADEVIVKAGGEYPHLEGLGSTIETLLIENGVATIGHIGDSRVYLLRRGELAVLTEDHSMIYELRKTGEMTEEEAARHPFRNKITRALGHMPSRDVDVAEVRIMSGDVFLMCSDGLTGVVSDERIHEALSGAEEELGDVCGELVEMANAAGGPDNISVIVARVL